ncbi:MFS transporter [Jannaschia pagri]|uniref:MFS transporter n=1 Tax=Jannaschia pagri TaxID=2829797 RepID=A0ABQ4NI22_9RHOB|nr:MULTISPECIES: MFS transporter [unclassified Jannaschia]GIT89832.1 MFS transporter [Jannaschia sp. AI_61]GIT94061.1 MFS transporter [Jannaschia sp. AI_62]
MSPIHRLIIASGLTNLGDGIMVLAWAWVASLLTRDPLLVALVPAAVRVPWLLLALAAGVMTDRLDRRALMASADGVRTVAFALLALAVWVTGPLPEPPATGVSVPALGGILVLTALVVGCAEVVRDSAAGTMVPNLVPSSQLEKANGQIASVETVGNDLAGPALGAFLVAAAVAAPFVVGAGLYMLGGVLVLGLAGQFRAPPRPRASMRRDLAEGLAFLRTEPLLMKLVWITATWNLFAEMALVGLVLHGQENLDLTAPEYGVVLALGALGGVLGGWLADGAVTRWGPGRVAQFGSIIGVPVFLAIAFAQGPGLVALGLFLFGLGGVLWNAVSTSYRQRRLPNALRGRVGAIYRLASFGAAPLGMVLSGVLVRWGEAIVGRPLALLLPFGVAALGMAVLNALIWRQIGTGFAVSRNCPPPDHTT